MHYCINSPHQDNLEQNGCFFALLKLELVLVDEINGYFGKDLAAIGNLEKLPSDDKFL